MPVIDLAQTVGGPLDCPGSLNTASSDRIMKSRMKLRQADVLIAQGAKILDVVRTLGVTQVTYYRWRREFGGLQTDQVKRMKDLELENQRLRKAVSDLTLDKLILSEAAKGNF